MRTNTLLVWGLATLMAMGIAAPGRAAKDDNPGRGVMTKVRVTVREVDEQDDVRAFQSWYGTQMRGYDRIDQETGERLADLIQMVVDVSDDRLLVTDQSNLRRGVILTNRTRIIADRDDFKVDEPVFGNMRKPTTNDTRRRYTMFRPGDLIIAEGYLRVNGGIMATTIRVIGRAHGWDNDDRGRRVNYGMRTWGEVRWVDARRGVVDLNAQIGRRNVHLDRTGVVMVNGRTGSLDLLRRGDRVIIYSRDIDRGGDLNAFRIVVLQDKDRYPDGDRPWYNDPFERDDRANCPMLEGRLRDITTGVLFNRMVIRGNDGREYTVRYSKTIKAIDRDGDLVSPQDLRDNERLCISYADVNGTFFAEQIEVQ